MKKLTIGRNNACDIVVLDTSDLVSRKQAVLTFSFFGKMKLYDTSNNGTYVNGQKLEKGKGLQVTRKDNINFARIADLDWSEVKDPYRKTKIYTFVGLLIAIFIFVSLTLWIMQPSSEVSPVPEPSEAPTEIGSTSSTVTTLDVPKERKQPPMKKVSRKKMTKSTKEITPGDVMDKEINEKSPIVY